MAAPTDLWLSTPRLTLSRPAPADTAAVYAIHSDPRTYEHAPTSRMQNWQQATDLLTLWSGHWDKHGFGYAVVRLRDRPTAIGFAGVKHHVLDGGPVLNLYYRFAPESWGSGLATEAAAAIVGWAAAHQPQVTVIARAATANPRSQRVAERTGLVRQNATDPGDPAAHHLYRSSWGEYSRHEGPLR